MRVGRDSVKQSSELMTAKIENGKVVIEIPVDFLVVTQEHRGDSPYKILDQKAMGEYVAKNILEYGGDSETGLTAFHMLIDGLFDEAYENGEEWLEMEEF